MSQAKVDQYKQEKANRKKIVAREKRFHVYRVLGAVVVLAAVVGWAGYSGYNAYQANQPAKSFYVNVDSITDYLSSISDAE